MVRLSAAGNALQTGLLSVEELKLLVETGSAQGQIEAEKEMIHGVIELGDKQIHEVMIPRIGIKAVEVDEPIDEVLDFIVKAGHSRVPVYRENLDNIVGILYAKDLLPYLRPSSDERSRSTFGPGPARGLRARDEAGGRDAHRDAPARRHIAIVVDEYGGTAGLVTIEDLVEEIVGDIQDEYDIEESLVEPVETDADRRAFRLDGRVTMDDLRDLFELSDAEEPDEEAYDTVGGLIIHRVGRIPLVGTEVDFRDLTLRVLAADSRRVEGARGAGRGRPRRRRERPLRRLRPRSPTPRTARARPARPGRAAAIELGQRFVAVAPSLARGRLARAAAVEDGEALRHFGIGQLAAVIGRAKSLVQARLVRFAAWFRAQMTGIVSSPPQVAGLPCPRPFRPRTSPSRRRPSGTRAPGGRRIGESGSPPWVVGGGRGLDAGRHQGRGLQLDHLVLLDGTPRRRSKLMSRNGPSHSDRHVW